MDIAVADYGIGVETMILTEEQVHDLVTEHMGWTQSIARSVARSWNMDWQLDGLDGAALEALLFCAKRFDPERGVPFRAYARKRIHESASEAARKTKQWHRGGPKIESDPRAHEVAGELLNIFPELRVGDLPVSEDSDDDQRASIRQLLMGAAIVTARLDGEEPRSVEDSVDTRRTVEIMATLDLVHQLILWKIYWEGESLRGVADEWETDELNIIREHKALLAFLQKAMTKGKGTQTPKVRPGLKGISAKLCGGTKKAPFSALLTGATPNTI